MEITHPTLIFAMLIGSTMVGICTSELKSSTRMVFAIIGTILTLGCWIWYYQLTGIWLFPILVAILNYGIILLMTQGWNWVWTKGWKNRH